MILTQNKLFNRKENKYMTTTLKEKDLTKVNGGKSEYISTINNILKIQRNIDNSCKDIKDDSNYKQAMSYISRSMNDLTCNNTQGAKTSLNQAIVYLKYISNNYSEKTTIINNYISQLSDIKDTL